MKSCKNTRFQDLTLCWLLVLAALGSVPAAAEERDWPPDTISDVFAFLKAEEIPCPEGAVIVGDEQYARCALVKGSASYFQKQWRRALRKHDREVQIVRQGIDPAEGTFTGSAVVALHLGFRYAEDTGLLTAAPAPTCFPGDEPAGRAPRPEFHDDIEAPERVRYARPEYPAKARAARAEGVVLVDAYILTDGRVGATCERFTNARGYDFESASREAVESWLYRPATKAGEPIPVIVSVRIGFTLH